MMPLAFVTDDRSASERFGRRWRQAVRVVHNPWLYQESPLGTSAPGDQPGA